jgi:hypothetical protein
LCSVSKIGSVMWFCRYLETSQYRGDSAKILVEILVELVYLKKKLPENFQCIAKKDVENQGCYKTTILKSYASLYIYFLVF